METELQHIMGDPTNVISSSKVGLGPRKNHTKMSNIIHNGMSYINQSIYAARICISANPGLRLILPVLLATVSLGGTAVRPPAVPPLSRDCTLSHAGRPYADSTI